jgi:hypothetical protein
MTKRKGREFEELVAMVERHLAPKGAVVRSPDQIKDRVSGQLREVDASIRYQVGSANVLITVECRDRSRVQDKQWIEQIAQKQRDIGANVTIAVSRRGLSKPAMKAATHHGIEVRAFSEINEQALREWATEIDLMYFHGAFGFDHCRVHFHDDLNDTLEPHDAVAQAFGPGSAVAPIMRRVADQQAVSIADLLEADERKVGRRKATAPPVPIVIPPGTSAQIAMNDPFPTLFEDVPINGEVVRKTRKWQFDRDEIEMRTRNGYAAVSSLEVQIHAKYFILPVHTGRLFAYSDSAGTIAQLERQEIVARDGQRRVFFISGQRKR